MYYLKQGKGDCSEYFDTLEQFQKAYNNDIDAMTTMFLNHQYILSATAINSFVQLLHKTINNNKENNHMQQNNVGWECPRCGSVNAPQQEKCKCVKTEQAEPPKKLLLE